jgi:hypothetical protein
MVKAKSRIKPERFLNWTPTPDSGSYLGRVVIKQGNNETQYLVQRLPADFGAAYRLEKLDGSGEAYDVCFESECGGHDSCECKGHHRWSHRTVCKHVAALLVLRQLKKI